MRRNKRASDYETEIVTLREKHEKAKARLDTSQNKELQRWAKFAELYSLFDFRITDDQLHKMFGSLELSLDGERDSIVFSHKQKFNRTELKLSSMKTQQRKQDAHEKIQLGGLVIKAGLRDVSPEIILGALMDLKGTLDDGDKPKIDALASIGSAALTPK